MKPTFSKNVQYYKFCLYGFLKNLKFFEPFLILFFLERGMSYLQIGSLYAIREFGRYLLEIPSGIIADVLGRRRTMITAFVFYIVSFLVFYVTKKYSTFVVAMLFFSFGDAFRTGTHKAMIFEYLKMKGWEKQKVHYYGHTRSWSQIGSAISSVLAATMVFYTGRYSAIFLFSTIPYIIDLFLMVSYPKELDGGTSDKNFQDVIIRFKTVIRDFLISFKNISTVKAIGNISFFSGYFQATKDYLQPVLQTLALSLPVLMDYGNKEKTAIVIGLTYFFIYLMTSRASRNSGSFSDLFKTLSIPLNITLYLGFAAGIGFGLFYSAGSVALSALLFMTIFIIENLRKPAGVSYVSEKFNKDILASALSANSQAQTLMSGIIALLLGYFADILGISRALLVVSGLLLLLSPLVTLKREKPKN